MNNPQCDSGIGVIPLEITTKPIKNNKFYTHTQTHCTFLFTVKFESMLKLNQYQKWGEKGVILAL